MEEEKEENKVDVDPLAKPDYSGAGWGGDAGMSPVSLVSLVASALASSRRI